MAFFHSNFLLQTHSHREDDHDNGDHNHPSTSLPHPFHQLPPSCTPQEFHGVGSVVGKRSSMPFPGTRMDADIMNNGINNNIHGEDELSDDGSQVGEKKRRLNMEQVRTLEKNFEVGSKLEPERKMQLARALGLQPRQIAIWFQNRRARWKTKKLEKDYDALKRQFEAVKAENKALEAHNKKLHAQIEAVMKTTATREPTELINLNKLETEGSSSNEEEENTSRSDEIIKKGTKDVGNNNNHNSRSMPLLPSSLQLSFQNNNSSSRSQVQCPKIDHHHQNVKEENLCNMFCGVDDQTAAGFWPWLEHQHFN